MGIERLTGKVTNEEVSAQLKDVISNQEAIEQIKNWMDAYAIEEERKRIEEVKAKAESEPAKKVKVPEIYAVAKPDEQKKGKTYEKPH